MDIPLLSLVQVFTQMTSTEPVIIGVIMEHRPIAVNVSNVDDIDSEEEEDQEETTPLASSGRWSKVMLKENKLSFTLVPSSSSFFVHSNPS